MSKSMHLGIELVEQAFERMRPKEISQLRSNPKERIVVIKGNYDQVEKILANARLPYKLLNRFPDKKDLNQGGKYRDCKIIFANCDSSYHEDLDEKNVTRENKRSIIDFVENGGRLITTDWAVNIAKYLFGKPRVKQDITDDEVVRVKFSSDRAREMAGITYGNASPKWWLESSSDIIHIPKNSGIVSLIESDDLNEKYGSPHIATGFNHGTGEVFNFISHLIAQRLKNYDKRDRECIEAFLNATNTTLRSTNKSKLTFGDIETTYTLMHTVIELCRDEKILNKSYQLKGGNIENV